MNEIDYNQPPSDYAHPCEEARQCQSSDSRSSGEPLDRALIDEFSRNFNPGLKKSSEGEKEMSCDHTTKVKALLDSKRQSIDEVEREAQSIVDDITSLIGDLVNILDKDREALGVWFDFILSPSGFISVDLAEYDLEFYDEDEEEDEEEEYEEEEYEEEDN